MGETAGLAACAPKLRVLAEPTRLRIIERLMRGPRHVGALNAGIGAEQSLLSHHLRVLRRAGFVEAVRDGRSVLYRLTLGLGRQRDSVALELGCCQVVFKMLNPSERRDTGGSTMPERGPRELP